jgi:dienelactone hydrolase
VNRWRKALVALVAVVAIGLITGCTVPRPAGNSPLRYRDAIFSSVVLNSNIQYGTAPDANNNPVPLTLDLYRPPLSDTQTKRPALVWVHGGGFSGGDKTNTVPVDVANTFAKQGYVVVSINYRLLGPGCTANPGMASCTVAALEAQHDAQAAVRWLRANAATYGVDPTRIGIGGESAGAITATLAGVRSDDPGDSGNPGSSSRIGAFVSISGGVPNDAFIDAGDTPGLLFHGTADTVVPSQWSIDTAVALLHAGVPAFLQLQEGAGHVPYAQYRDLFVEQTDYFLYDALDLAHARGQPVGAARAFDRRLVKLRKQYPRDARRADALRRSHRQYLR